MASFCPRCGSSLDENGLCPVCAAATAAPKPEELHLAPDEAIVAGWTAVRTLRCQVGVTLTNRRVAVITARRSLTSWDQDTQDIPLKEVCSVRGAHAKSINLWLIVLAVLLFIVACVSFGQAGRSYTPFLSVLWGLIELAVAVFCGVLAFAAHVSFEVSCRSGVCIGYCSGARIRRGLTSLPIFTRCRIPANTLARELSDAIATLRN